MVAALALYDKSVLDFYEIWATYKKPRLSIAAIVNLSLFLI
jgi:hypothetical protein